MPMNGLAISAGVLRPDCAPVAGACGIWFYLRHGTPSQTSGARSDRHAARAKRLLFAEPPQVQERSTGGHVLEGCDRDRVPERVGMHAEQRRRISVVAAS